MLPGVRMAEKSAAACAVTSWREQLFVGWTGTDLSLNVVTSPRWGEFTGKQRLPERSYKRVTRSTSSTTATSTGTSHTSSTTTENVALRPALAGYGDCLYIAWTGTDGALNVAVAEPGPYPGPTTFRERSLFSPSLMAAPAGGLMLAWTGTDSHVNLVMAADVQPGAPVQLTQAKNRLEVARSGQAPAVCGHGEAVALAWTGTDRHVNVLVNAAAPARPPLRLEQARSSAAPALCSHQGTLALAWTGTDRHINLLANAEDPGLAPVRLEEAKSSGAPALCSHDGTLVLAWTGTDRRPNLARLP